MEYQNTTDIPNRLIEIATAFSIQEGVKLSEIVVKNKQVGVLSGRFGWYHPTDEKIVLVVPPSIPIIGIRRTGRYSGLRFSYMTRAEFIVGVMAHELRHAWQWQAAGNSAYRMSNPLRERDAEQYEYGMLAKWRQMVAAQTSTPRVA